MGTVNVVLGEDTRLNLILGQQLENAVTSVVFDFSAWQTAYGSGTLALSVQRPGDDQPYAVTMTTSGTNATWSVTNLDTAYKGVGHIQLTYTVGSAIKKSVVYKFTVYESLGANGEYPSPGQTWQEGIEDDIEGLRTDVDADHDELIDIREGADGVTYPSAGDAVRGQITDVKSDFQLLGHELDSVAQTNLYTLEGFVYDKYISDEGIEVSYVGAGHTAYIPVDENNYYDFSFLANETAPQSSTTIRVHAFDSSKNWMQQIKTYSINHGSQTAKAVSFPLYMPTGCKYIIISQGLLSSFNSPVLSNLTLGGITAVDRVAREKANTVDMTNEGAFEELSLFSAGITSNGWKLKSDGFSAEDASYCIKKYKVASGQFIKVVSDHMNQFQNNISVPSSGTSNRIGKTYLTGTYYFKVPSEATYLIMSTFVNGSTHSVTALRQSSVAISEFESYIDGRIANPPMEFGDIYNNSGTLEYYDSTERVRTCQNSSVTLEEGTVVSLSDYDGYRFLLFFYDNDTGKWTKVDQGWMQKDFVISASGQYKILMSEKPQGTITNIRNLTDLLVIRYNSKFSELIETESSVKQIESRAKVIDNIENIAFELGDLYVNSSGDGTYYDSTSRIRTIQNQPLTLSKGDVLSIHTNTVGAVMIVRKRIQQGKYQTVSNGFKSTECLIPEDGNYEILCRYTHEATITDLTNFSNLFYIKKRWGVLTETTNIQNITDVYKEELKTTILTARQKTTGRGLMFGIITDTHLDNTTVEYYNQTMENLERLNDGLQFNGIVHLGDIINGYDSKDIAKYHLQYAVDRLLKIGGEKTYITVGNHDNDQGAGDSQRLSDSELYSYIQRFNEHYVDRTMSATNSVYESQTSNYYVDYPSLKIRMIMFDSCYYSQGFSLDMLEWMGNLFEETPSDYNFVLFTHMSTEVLSSGGAIGNADIFKDLLAQYADRIYCYIHGHSHFDYVGYDNGFAQISLCCSVPTHPVQVLPEGGVQPTRTLGTVTQDCINVIIILPDEQKVELVRFGAGDDMTIPFRQ